MRPPFFSSAMLMLSVTLILMLVMGCAPLLKIRTEVTPEQESGLVKPVDDVQVVLDGLPAGLSVEDNQLQVSAGMNYTVLGRFKMESAKGLFPEYKTPWRKYYCYPQRGLLIPTLFLWELVPLYYPCQTRHTYPIAEIRSAIVRLGRKVGGNVVVAVLVDSDDGWSRGAVGFILYSTTVLSEDRLGPLLLDPHAFDNDNAIIYYP